MKQQPKSGSKSKRKRIVAKRTARNGASITEYSDGSRTLRMTPRTRQLMEQQFEAFKEKFGREPGPGDPIFFDPDADAPQPMDMGEMWGEAIKAAVKVGISPELVFAMWITERAVTADNKGLLSAEELREWEDAVQE